MKNFVIDRKEFTSSSDWHTSNALHMMKLSYAVYAGTTDDVGAKEDWSITDRLVRKAGYEIRKVEAKDGIYEPNAMVCWDDTNVFLIFRGTEPTAWNQWATDANIVKASFCIGEVHEGFLTSVELIWPQIVSCLQEANLSQQKSLFVGGHSLGAGMSQAAVSKLEFEEERLQPTAVYNFGCPRALNLNGADLYNERLGSRTYRVVNNNDIVCGIPLESMGFSHVGRLRYLTSDGKLLDDPASARLKLDRLLGRIRSLAKLNPADFVTDHLPDNYTKILSAIYNRELVEA